MRLCSGVDRATSRTAFTLVEILVLVAVGALLLGLLVPAIGRSRDRARTIDCAAREQQLGIAMSLYRNDFAGCLPQRLSSIGPAPGVVTAIGFGGKAGTNDATPASERPLNRYVVAGDDAAGTDGGSAFRSPSDRGGLVQSGLPVATMFEAFGTSYVLNDHMLRASPNAAWIGTLVPTEGGAMPTPRSPERTWMLGSRPIYNFDQGGDARMHWYTPERVRANLLMADMHVQTTVDVPAGAIETTDRYTFSASP